MSDTQPPSGDPATTASIEAPSAAAPVPAVPPAAVPPPEPTGREPRGRPDIPSWLQAIAALLTVSLSAIALILSVGQANPGPSSAPAGTTPTKPIVEVTGFVVAGDGIEVSGFYRALRPAEETLYLVARPRTEPDRDWLPVRAELRPSNAASAVQDGDWTAFLPVPEGAAFAVQPLVLPGVPSSGATSGQLALVRETGAAAEGVIASGAEAVVER